MDLPAARFFLKNEFFFFEFLGKKSVKKKSWNSEKWVDGMDFWIKRQTGNVLEYFIFVIRKILTDGRPMKVHFTEKIRPELAGPASTF